MLQTRAISSQYIFLTDPLDHLHLSLASNHQFTTASKSHPSDMLHVTCGRSFLLLFVFLISLVHHHYPRYAALSTLCLKKVLTFKLSVTLSSLNRFSKFSHCWKAHWISLKRMQHYPPHLKRVATLPWEIKHSNFLQIFRRHERKCKQIAFYLL